jgi:rhomboid protease GluP
MVSQIKNKSLLCPRCRKLISRSEPACPHCNLANPGSRWKNNYLTRGLLSQNGLIRAILLCNIVMFVLSVVIEPHTLRFSASPFEFLSPGSNSLMALGSTGTIPIFQFHHYWSLISANYLHASLLHILFNMIALLQLAPLVSREYGEHRMVIIYTLAGVAGYVLSIIAGVQLTLGASAAICGLLGALLYYGKSRGGDYGQNIFRQVGGWAVGIGIFGFIVPGINNWGHGGGMLAGVILGFLLGYREREKETFIHRSMAMACIVITGGVLVWSCIYGVVLLYF